MLNAQNSVSVLILDWVLHTLSSSAPHLIWTQVLRCLSFFRFQGKNVSLWKTYVIPKALGQSSDPPDLTGTCHNQQKTHSCGTWTSQELAQNCVKKLPWKIKPLSALIPCCGYRQGTLFAVSFIHINARQSVCVYTYVYIQIKVHLHIEVSTHIHVHTQMYIHQCIHS